MTLLFVLEIFLVPAVTAEAGGPDAFTLLPCSHAKCCASTSSMCLMFLIDIFVRCS